MDGGELGAAGVGGRAVGRGWRKPGDAECAEVEAGGAGDGIDEGDELGEEEVRRRDGIVDLTDFLEMV